MHAGRKTALVLAGGGAKGAFEAGAVTYLVDELGVVPDVITATSAGAVCAAVLAQARTHEEFHLRAAELHNDILAISRQELLFGKQGWVAALEGTMFGEAIDRMVVEETRPPIPGDAALPVAPMPPPPPGRRLARVARSSLSVARALPKLGRAGKRLRGGSGSLFTLDPLGHGLRVGLNGLTPINARLVARPGLELRIAVVAMGAGTLRYVTESGEIVGADAVTPVPGPGRGPVDLIEAVLASASVPVVFAPRRLADDAYVDGGVVDNVPVAAAARLGAQRIFAILAVPLDPPPERRDYADASAPVVFLRSIGAISFAERQRANLFPPLDPGTEVTVIDPIVDVVGPFEVSQGLMLLDMDYGWLRAADVVADLDDATRQIAADTADGLTIARTQAWHREREMWNAGTATAADLSALARVKRTVRDALNARKALGLAVPDGAERWWSSYEVHRGVRPSSLPPTLRTVVES